MGDIKVAIIGLDTSHAVEFARRMAAPDCKPELKVPGLKATMAYRFKSLFQSEENQDKRQKQLEDWGIKTTLNLDEAVKGADALVLEVNDPDLHLDIFKQCAGYGLPIFLDKPPADTYSNFKEICNIAKAKKIRFFSASGMRFVPPVLNACKAVPKPLYATVYGAVGGAPVPNYPYGKLVVWYGIHTFEILNRAMGRGAVSVFAKADHIGCIAHVEFSDKRRGIVELTNSVWLYGGSLRMADKAEYFTLEIPYMVHNQVTDILTEIREFFKGGPLPVAEEDTLEVMNMLYTAKRSIESGKPELLSK